VTYTVQGTTTTLQLPNADVSFSPTANLAGTTFDSTTNTWETVVPLNPGGNVFLGGGGVQFPQGLPGGANPVNWSAAFTTDTPGVSLNWQWAAAVYTQFSTDNNALNVKPVDSNKLSQYPNSDHAGTPEAYTLPGILPGGARGGGGSNWTGSYSGTASVTPAPMPPPTTPPTTGSISGAVLTEGTDAGMPGVTIILSWVDSSGQSHAKTTVTNGVGAFTFSDLSANDYTLTEVPPSGYQDDYINNGIGTLGGSTGFNMIGGVVLQSGQNGFSYNFENVTQGS
jgi:hypothetical protein